jgi:cytochrome c peroxidase
MQAVPVQQVLPLLHPLIAMAHSKSVLSLLLAITFVWLQTAQLQAADGIEPTGIESGEMQPAEMQPRAAGYGDLGYAVPPAGTYNLPSLGIAADGVVLNSDNEEQQLRSLFEEKYVLLSFIYSRCDDVNGCPLSSYVFYQIKTMMQQDPVLAKNLKLISLSFDPEYDTAEVLKLYANNFSHADNRGEWEFLSTSSLAKLTPLLESYGQDIQREMTLKDGSSRYSHILRVFLIDPDLHIRNIYSVAFLHKDLLINDVKTLMQEQQYHSVKAASVQADAFSIMRPGDDKSNYESGDYFTRAQAVVQRKGQPRDLVALAENLPAGLPEIPIPAQNPITRDRVALGRKLFYDRRLSLNDTFSCAMCHIPEQGFSSNELATAVGIEGRSVRRNTPTLYNVAYADLLFHDAREFSLEQQVWGPLLARNEMGNPSVGHVIKKVSQLADYQGLFEQAFDGRPVSMQTLGDALASYQRVLVSANSPFDRWHYSNDLSALSPSAKRGFTLFTGKAGCSSCHLVGEKHALFMDNQLHNTGVGYNESMGIRPATERVQLAPGVYVDMDTSVIDKVGHAAASDVGQYEVTENPAHRWKYKTPTLRNIALTAPYMHNGSLSTLLDVVEFYDSGGVENPLQDARIKPLGLSPNEKKDLVDFLSSLTGSNIQQIVSDAFSAPIGDIGSEQGSPK